MRLEKIYEKNRCLCWIIITTNITLFLLLIYLYYMRGIKIQFEPNEKIGRLTAVKNLNKSCDVGRNARRTMWLFRCDCGKEIEAVACDVKYRRKLSCGCLQLEHWKNCGNRLSPLMTKPNKEGPVNKLYGNYIRQAKRRGYSWDLSKDQFRELIKQNCYYCGSEPLSEYTTARKITSQNILLYNGVDRKDNKLGYTKENCITACGICNRMKMDLDFNTFITLIKKINQKLCVV